MLSARKLVGYGNLVVLRNLRIFINGLLLHPMSFGRRFGIFAASLVNVEAKLLSGFRALKILRLNLFQLSFFRSRI